MYLNLILIVYVAHTPGACFSYWTVLVQILELSVASSIVVCLWLKLDVFMVDTGGVFGC